MKRVWFRLKGSPATVWIRVARPLMNCGSSDSPWILDDRRDEDCLLPGHLEDALKREIFVDALVSFTKKLSLLLEPDVFVRVFLFLCLFCLTFVVFWSNRTFCFLFLLSVLLSVLLNRFGCWSSRTFVEITFWCWLFNICCHRWFGLFLFTKEWCDLILLVFSN